MPGGNHPGQAGKANTVLSATVHPKTVATCHPCNRHIPAPGALAIQTDSGTGPLRGLLTREGSASLARLIPVTLRSVVAVDRQEGTSHTSIHISHPGDSGMVTCQYHQGLRMSTELQYNVGNYPLQATPPSPPLLTHPLLSIPPTGAQHKRKATKASLPLPPLC